MANIRSRVPDILLTFEWENETRHILIEIKKTKNINYILESIYKMFGYVNDFKSVLHTSEVQGILIVNYGINNAISEFDDKLWAINFNNVNNTFNKLLTNYIK